MNYGTIWHVLWCIFESLPLTLKEFFYYLKSFSNSSLMDIAKRMVLLVIHLGKKWTFTNCFVRKRVTFFFLFYLHYFIFHCLGTLRFEILLSSSQNSHIYFSLLIISAFCSSHWHEPKIFLEIYLFQIQFYILKNILKNSIHRKHFFLCF